MSSVGTGGSTHPSRSAADASRAAVDDDRERRPSTTFWDMAAPSAAGRSAVRSSTDRSSSPRARAPSTDGLSHAHHVAGNRTEADVLPPEDLAYDDLTRVAGEVEIPDIDDDRTLPLVEGDAASEDEAAGSRRPRFSWRLLWAYTGPGWLMSIAYLDPGNLESDLQAGAYTGYQLMWVLFWSTALGLVLQVLAARLGVVTGKHLAQLCREQYRPFVSRALWLMAELAIIGSDIQEVIGSAIAFKILFGLPLWAGALITAADTFTFLGLHAFGVRKLEAFFAVLIGTMAVCFFVEAATVRPPIADIGKGFLPEVSDYAVVQAVSIVGAVIMPHNIFLHSALVQSRAVDRTRPSKVREANFYFAIEAAIALGVSFFINLAVVSVFAKGFFSHDCAEQGMAQVTRNGVKECGHIGLQEAGDALTELLGKSASYIWAVGLLAAGQSSTMTGTFAGQFVMEGFLTLRLAAWKRVIFTRALALLPALLVALLAPSQDSHAGDTLDEYLNILQSMQLPFALLPLLHFTSSRRVMGAAFVNGRKMRWFLWAVVVGILGINLYLVSSEIFDVSQSGLPGKWWMYLILSVLLFAYAALIYIVVHNDVKYAVALARRAWNRRKNGPGAGHGAEGSALVPEGEAEEELTLEEAFDQPEEGSPAWNELQRIAKQSHYDPPAAAMPQHHQLQQPSPDPLDEDSGEYAALQHAAQ